MWEPEGSQARFVGLIWSNGNWEVHRCGDAWSFSAWKGRWSQLRSGRPDKVSWVEFVHTRRRKRARSGGSRDWGDLFFMVGPWPRSQTSTVLLFFFLLILLLVTYLPSPVYIPFFDHIILWSYSIRNTIILLTADWRRMRCSKRREDFLVLHTSLLAGHQSSYLPGSVVSRKLPNRSRSDLGAAVPTSSIISIDVYGKQRVGKLDP